MKYKLTRSAFFIMIFSFLISGCNSKSHKINVEIDPHYIKANEPFRLVLNVSGPNLPKIKPKSDIPNPRTNDFIIEGVNTLSFSSSYNGKESVSQTYSFILIPKKAGDLIIAPWQLIVNTEEKYTTDSIRIHVYQERITTIDSLERMKTVKSMLNIGGGILTSNHEDDSNSYPKPFGYPMKPGIFFKNADSLYVGKIGMPLEIVYTLSFLNAGKVTKSGLSEITITKFESPVGINKIATRDSIIEMHGANYNLYIKKYIIKICSSKKGCYNYPPITFAWRDKTYTAPTIRILIN